MELQCLGAAECVTGSCHLIKVRNKTILLDCGLYQGRDGDHGKNEKFQFNPKDIDLVILSHAHIDHSGRIPLLYRKGFKGEIICTKATMELCQVMLTDSGHIQEMEVAWKNRKLKERGLQPKETLYSSKIAEECLKLFKSYSYNAEIKPFDGLTVIFKDAGHLLGSAIIELQMEEKEGSNIKLVYSGDLGNFNIPLINDPTFIGAADYVIMETTYGDKVHNNFENVMKELSDIVKKTFDRGGNVIIPSFAVGRTQEVLYALNKYIEEGLVKNCYVYVDSPLAEKATKIFENNREIFDDEAKELEKHDTNILDFEGLKFTHSSEESMELNKMQRGIVIISTSGMCDAGRIKHHLKHNLWRSESSIVFVGYQAEGTLGREILEGNKMVKIFGKDISVAASIYNLQSLSGHADRNGLINWIKNIEGKPKQVFLVHGDENSQKSFKELLNLKGYESVIVKSGEKYKLE
ncbi:MBL fold metallo-hydrolase [Clostridium sp. CM028]|uniref:MBL fold metallo-hydrolase RNA specificity domain-containing protein n=1 Tax=Clostridium sp. CM028 TaxID=2851575 RepID=UPI001C6EFFD7|nr:MBL fold metallo-hydrolase [Clostridium sp. CM028]MBW9147447.1 MBL fold metallo-hydrolase [Clostridium sp. CM028]WLC61787.1 MBL fold metallo-hydrolase [Clostridium sp. CM028]